MNHAFLQTMAISMCWAHEPSLWALLGALKASFTSLVLNGAWPSNRFEHCTHMAFNSNQAAVIAQERGPVLANVGPTLDNANSSSSHAGPVMGWHQLLLAPFYAARNINKKKWNHTLQGALRLVFSVQGIVCKGKEKKRKKKKKVHNQCTHTLKTF